MIDRRAFLQLAGASGLALAAPGCASHSRPLDRDVWRPLAENDLGFAGLATSLPQEHDYVARVEGALPPDLRGTLYRNGPGLFDRGAHRKRMLLDGDGMIQAFRFGEGGVRYRNRFVRTSKFVAEEAAGDFLYGTWSTSAPGGPFAGWRRGGGSQAGVTVVRRGGTLWAFDDGSRPYRLDPETLETRGEGDPDDTDGRVGYKAHWKIDGATDEWIQFGMSFGPRFTIHVAVVAKDGALRRHFHIPSPRPVWLHDWLVSERHVVLILHPGFIRPSGALRMLLGLESPADVIRFEPEHGNLVLIQDREGRGDPVLIETEALWMWHSLNAYERGGEIIADFVGWTGGSGIGDRESPLFTLMEGRMPDAARERPRSRVYRYVIDPHAASLRREVLADDSGYELPVVAPQRMCHPHRFGYFARNGQADLFWSSVARVDTGSGRVDAFDFGPGQYCAEPIFAPRPASPGEEPGWLLTLVYDAGSKRSCLAVLDAEHVAEGPVARVHLTHHAPLSFHGTWYGEA